MPRCFLIALFALYAALPPGICACRLDALVWAALTQERLPDCHGDPHEHDHHCPGAKNLFVQAETPCPTAPVLAIASIAPGPASPTSRTAGPCLKPAPSEFDKPPLILLVCALRI